MEDSVFLVLVLWYLFSFFTFTQLLHRVFFYSYLHIITTPTLFNFKNYKTVCRFNEFFKVNYNIHSQHENTEM